MKICFPVLKADGLDSEIYGHFGSAPAFVVVDTANNHVTMINNKEQHHEHGACNPLGKFDDHQVDTLVVGGIGMGAFNMLNQSGIKVFKAKALTVRENMALMKAGNLPEFTSQHTCAGHSLGGGCGLR